MDRDGVTRAGEAPRAEGRLRVRLLLGRWGPGPRSRRSVECSDSDGPGTRHTSDPTGPYSRFRLTWPGGGGGGSNSDSRSGARVPAANRGRARPAKPAEPGWLAGGTMAGNLRSAGSRFDRTWLNVQVPIRCQLEAGSRFDREHAGHCAV